MSDQDQTRDVAPNIPAPLTSPGMVIVRMVLFLALAGFLVLILNREIIRAFMANPGLNGLILGVLAVGIGLALRAVARLFREVSWVNARAGTSNGEVRPPVLLAPMQRLLERDGARQTIQMPVLRAILDSLATRLDESRDTLRYLTGLMIFLGLLGTFWGLLETVGSIGNVINAMQGGADSNVLFEDLKNGIAKPLAGMSLSFTASLFGLAGSLVLGFLDLQAGHAQSRFYVELEDHLTAQAATPEAVAVPGLDKIAMAGSATPQSAANAMANLAEGVQSLVQHMRGEQQLIRDWVQTQADANRDLKKMVERIVSETERR